MKSLRKSRLLIRRGINIVLLQKILHARTKIKNGKRIKIKNRYTMVTISRHYLMPVVKHEIIKSWCWYQFMREYNLMIAEKNFTICFLGRTIKSLYIYRLFSTWIRFVVVKGLVLSCDPSERWLKPSKVATSGRY